MRSTFLSRIFELPGSSSRYQAMEGLRAYAALLIFCVHYFDAFGRIVWELDFNTFRLDHSPSVFATVSYYFFASHYGVDLFFLLSGFLICRMIRKPSFKYGAFLRQRIIRVYPAFVLSLAIWAVIRIGIQQWYGLDAAQLIGNLLFLNAVPSLNVVPYSMVTWSLFYEFLFYLIFPAILVIPGVRKNFGAAFTMSYGILLVIGLQYLFGGMFIRFAMFFAGVWIAFIDDKTLGNVAGRLPMALVLTAYLGSTLFFARELGYERFIPVFWVTSSLLVIKVIFDKGLLNRLFKSTPLRYLGNISYSFYLVHGLGIEIVMRQAGSIIDLFGPGLGLVLTLLPAFALSFLISTVLFLLAEKPYFTWRRRSSMQSLTEGPAIT
jgi:exopolysaccharide production protein ExoZ